MLPAFEIRKTFMQGTAPKLRGQVDRAWHSLTRRAPTSLSPSNIVFGVSTRVIPCNTQPSVADTSTLLLHGHVCICVMS